CTGSFTAVASRALDCCSSASVFFSSASNSSMCFFIASSSWRMAVRLSDALDADAAGAVELAFLRKAWRAPQGCECYTEGHLCRVNESKLEHEKPPFALFQRLRLPSRHNCTKA